MRERIIVALDTDMHTALDLARQLEGRARWMKVGMTLFYAEGAEVIRRMRDLGYDVFLDLKLHDIPHQVRGAAREAARHGIGMLTVHALGGVEMMRAAVEGAAEGAAAAGVEPPAILAVTVLTSMDEPTLRSIGVDATPETEVRRLAELARDARVDGIVCSPNEAPIARSVLGNEALVVTPGVRPLGADRGDQSRVATPADAIAAGASHLVIGRPITAAPVPAEAFELIANEGA